MAFEHDLERAPQANGIGEENAFLKVDLRAVGDKAPGLAVGRRQSDGVGVAREIRGDARMQMEADRKAPDGLKFAAVARG